MKKYKLTEEEIYQICQGERYNNRYYLNPAYLKTEMIYQKFADKKNTTYEEDLMYTFLNIIMKKYHENTK